MVAGRAVAVGGVWVGCGNRHIKTAADRSTQETFVKISFFASSGAMQ